MQFIQAPAQLAIRHRLTPRWRPRRPAGSPSSSAIFHSPAPTSSPPQLVAARHVHDTLERHAGLHHQRLGVAGGAELPERSRRTWSPITRSSSAIYDPMVPPTFTSLEGYAAAQVFVAGLLAEHRRLHLGQPDHHLREAAEPPVDTLGGGGVLAHQPQLLEVRLRDRHHPDRENFSNLYSTGWKVRPFMTFD